MAVVDSAYEVCSWCDMHNACHNFWGSKTDLFRVLGKRQGLSGSLALLIHTISASVRA